MGGASLISVCLVISALRSPGCLAPVMGSFRSADVRQLLHNKFVVVLGDSIQRSVYKDLVKLLQDDTFLSEAQLKRKGEVRFTNDTLVEGGELTGLHNETTFREVRQYRTGHHLVRFYFLTRVYSDYLESILSDFKSGPQPDVVIVNSCVWDLLRYHNQPLETYKTNLDVLFRRLKEVLSPECLIIWTMTMPVGYKENEIPPNTSRNVRLDIVEGNFFSASIADNHKLDVLDMHYHFRLNLLLRCHDAVHWDRIAHRKYTQILLSHIAQAWEVEAPKGKMPDGATYVSGYTSFDGGSIDDIPGVLCPNEKFINSNAPSPFVTDSPLLTADIGHGYFLPPPGPAVSSYAFPGGNFFFTNMPPPMGFIPFPNHVPYPLKAWNMKKSKRGALRGKRTHPYR
ncbi:PC-esterase domain-containing protein 1A-like [Hyla sarda]|uniref:PC-esterase domain-containing protein 1A-like n=1 Tax=Hyla sarda TaxID=327740 RepID=UPI0024C24152|nr:PC-esterase domain-containing protein 1A-like [Hyla sarda]